jgi:integrase/recombinase XerD
MIHDLGEENEEKHDLSLPMGLGIFAVGAPQLPAMITRAGEDAVRRFIEFFTATIRNRNTRAAYAQAIGQFCRWAEERRFELTTITPVAVAAYIEQLEGKRSAPTVKQHLAAIRMLFDFLVTGHVIDVNPALSVKGPRYVVKKGKTPVLTATEARLLLDSIEIDTLIGLRDRALIALMCYSFARVTAAVGMNREDYYQQGKEYLDAYLTVAEIGTDRKQPVFCSAIGQSGALTNQRMSRTDVFRMVKRRAAACGIGIERICCHTFRATGITAYLENGGTIEHAQAIAAHESPRTTKLYDRTNDALSLDEIERIAI